MVTKAMTGERPGLARLGWGLPAAIRFCLRLQPRLNAELGE